MLTLDFDEYAVARLSPADEEIVQALYERCSDYHLLEEGTPTRPGAARHLLTALPPGKQPDIKYVLGFHGADGGLVGVLDLIRDFPAEGEWWIGLLMLDPAVRGTGVGERIFRSAARAIAGRGGTTIYLGVLEANPAAQRFWRRRGFQELRREPYTASSGHRGIVIIMRIDVA